MIRLFPVIGFGLMKKGPMLSANLKLAWFSLNIVFTWAQKSRSKLMPWMLDVDVRLWAIGTSFRIYQLGKV